jgi:hypothetical protein
MIQALCARIRAIWCVLKGNVPEHVEGQKSRGGTSHYNAIKSID